MAWDDEYELPGHWSEPEMQMYHDAFGEYAAMAEDRTLQLLFDAALFEEMTPRERDDVYAALQDYLWDEYEIDFDDVFDWEDYREWYSSL